jgi:hypothetical protein
MEAEKQSAVGQIASCLEILPIGNEEAIANWRWEGASELLLERSE